MNNNNNNNNFYSNSYIKKPITGQLCFLVLRIYLKNEYLRYMMLKQKKLTLFV